MFVGSLACCDDIAFLTKSKDEIMFNEGKHYSGKYRYESHPTKTNIVDLVNGCKVNGDMTWNSVDNVLGFSDTAVHLGVTRAGKTNQTLILMKGFRFQIDSEQRTSKGFHWLEGLPTH